MDFPIKPIIFELFLKMLWATSKISKKKKPLTLFHDLNALIQCCHLTPNENEVAEIYIELLQLKSLLRSQRSQMSLLMKRFEKKTHFCLRDSNKTHPCGHCCAISHILCPCKLSVKTIKLGFTTLFDLRLWGKRLRDFKTDFKNHATLSLIFLIEVL